MTGLPDCPRCWGLGVYKPYEVAEQYVCQCVTHGVSVPSSDLTPAEIDVLRQRLGEVLIRRL